MGNKIYVGNLSYKIDEEGLKKVFSEIGEVQSVKIITDAMTGQSKGFGFIEMTSEADAEKAISTLNGSTLMDRTITVSEARPQRERERSSGAGGGRRGFDRSKRGPSSGKRNTGNWR